MKPQMHADEIALLRSFMTNADAYFEFGMGGSTVLASQLVRRRITAVDTSLEWVNRVSDTIKRPDGKTIELKHIDLGKLGPWGTPITREKEASFPSYSCAIIGAGSDFDLCLVDGRFRVASFLRALEILRNDAVIAMHDYPKRPNYHIVEKYARPIASAVSIKFFVRRADANLEDIKAEAVRHSYDFS